MSWMLQFLWLAILVVGVVLALWVSLWVLLAIFALGVAAVIWAHVRDFLLAKGILNPTPGVAPVVEEGADKALPPVIEGDYKRVDSE